MQRANASPGLCFPVWVGGVFRAAVDFAYPPACRLCGSELPEPAGAHAAQMFCETCAEELTSSHTLACQRCGASIGPGLDPQRPCAFCCHEGYAFERTVRLGVYDGALRTACLEIKRPGTEAFAAALAELTWQQEEAPLKEFAVDVVIPVPRFWVQRFLPGHHASETLAQVWGSRLKVSVLPHILRKNRWTRPQARLTPSERRVNLRNAFTTVGKNPLAGATVLLADDVMTTGATANEASRQLIRAGAARVVVAVIARGLGRR